MTVVSTSRNLLRYPRARYEGESERKPGAFRQLRDHGKNHPAAGEVRFEEGGMRPAPKMCTVHWGPTHRSTNRRIATKVGDTHDTRETQRSNVNITIDNK